MTLSLTSRRKAAYAINMTCSQLGLANLAEHFDPERHEEWVVVSTEEVRALKYGKRVATVYLDDEIAQVIIEDVEDLIRTKHFSEFNRDEFVMPNDARDAFDQKIRPDLDATVDVSDVPGIDLPGQILPRTAYQRKIEVIGSLGS